MTERKSKISVEQIRMLQQKAAKSMDDVDKRIEGLRMTANSMQLVLR